MSVPTRDRPEQAEAVPTAIEAASWWQPFPGWLGGVASVGGVFGLIPFDRRRFDPSVDALLLSTDGARLTFQFKLARADAARALEAEETEAQPRLFDPDTK
jgi:hypothetical protein